MRPIYFPDLPKLWTNVRLFEVSEIIMGQSPPGETYNENGIGLPFFQGKAEFGELYPTPRKWCSAPTRVAEKGDILISVRAPVGPTNIAKEKCCIGRGLAAIRPSKDFAERDFLLFYLRSIEDFLSTAGYGSTFQAINKDELLKLPIPLPPLPEQERIINILQQADKLEKLHSPFFEDCLFIKNKILSDILEVSYKTKKNIPLGKVTPFVTSGSRDWSRYYTQNKEDPKFIRVQNIKNGVLDLSDCANVKPPDSSESRRARVEPNDILISITGTIGQAAFVPERLGEAYISQHVAIVRTDGSLPVRFWVDFINHPRGGQLQLQRVNYGQTKPGLNLTQIKDIKIPILESKIIQNYVRCSAETEILINRFRSSEIIYHELTRCLLNDAISGNLTESWRQKNKTLLEKAARKLKRPRGISGTFSIKTELAAEDRPWLDQPNRLWLMEQLSDWQKFVYETIRDWEGTFIPSEDWGELKEEEFLDDPVEDAKDQFLKTLDQLAALGLIAKISLDNQEGEYVTAFRGLREEEFSQVADRNYLDKG